MKNKIITISLIILCVFSSIDAVSQVSSSELDFDKKHIDFGVIQMEGGIVTAHYTVKNNSNKMFEISNLEGSCGCTNVTSSATSVAAGKSVVISADFDPDGLVGTTTKRVYVRGNLNDVPEIVLSFSAEIEAPKERDPNAYYPGEFGYLLLQTTHIDLGNQHAGFSGSDSILLANDGYNAIQITEINGVPDYLSFPQLPLIIPPKEKGFLLVDVDLSTLDTVGPVSGKMRVITDDKFFPRKSLSYSVDMYKDYSKMKRRHLRKAPRLSIDNKDVQLGKMKAGSKKSASVNITNTGKKDLKILRVKTDCACALLSGLDRTIAPGESIEVKAQFDSINKNGAQAKPITIYTNDPRQPIHVITLRALVD